MTVRFVLLWTDAALWAVVAALAAYGWRVSRRENLRATWARVLLDAPAMASAVVLAAFIVVALLDSVHFRRALPPAAGAAQGAVYFDARVESLLDLALARQHAMRESSYSEPLATHGLTREAMLRDGATVKDFPRLQHGAAHLADPDREWTRDVLQRLAAGLASGLVLWCGAAALVIAALARRRRRAWSEVAAAVARDRTRYPLRAALVTLALMALLGGAIGALMGHYHVFGTDRTGNDVLVQSLKSVRTAFVIGMLSTLCTLPIAVALGVLAGWFRGWVDELVQYLYTTLSSVPNVLLIAACVLMVQVALDQNPQWFDTGAERADLKIFLLCAILGITGWATLCRLVRAETLKLRELEFVQAATAFGVSPLRIMSRHIVPNVMHLVLITTVLSFSDLILYEAVLTYVGVGVDPTLNSFGGMINLARNEMSRDPVVWWSFASAFVYMVALVLAANLFADGVRDAFDPRARAVRARPQPRRPAP